jgi:hypothetical protein
MAGNESPWRDGRRAWERLRRWSRGKSGSTPGPDPGEALTALADIGLVRRLLDNTELAAVKAARQQHKSWAEIATKLGVTRQSAWERWRDLDDAGDRSLTTGFAAVGSAGSDATTAPSVQRSDRSAAGTSLNSVVVPNVIGMSFDEARRVLHEARLVPVGSDPDGPPLFVLGLSGAVVVNQDPKAGLDAAPGSSVTVWLGRGGGSAGIREPRRPMPDPKSIRGVPEDSRDETFR